MGSHAAITVVSSALEASIAGPLRDAPRVRSLAELRALLVSMLDEPATGPRRLELRGHSTRGAQLLRLGATIVDMTDPSVLAFFRALANDRILPRLGVVELRLLGCGTAGQPPGRLTIRMLAHVLHMPVYGTTKRLFRHHYTMDGFDAAFEHLLVEASQLPRSRLPKLDELDG